MYIENIDKIENSFDVYIKNSKLSNSDGLNRLEKIAVQYDASIIRTDELFENNKTILYKSGIFSEYYFRSLGIKVFSGKYPEKKEEYIATYDTKSSKQVGTVNDIFQDTPLIFGSLANFFKNKESSINGMYTVVVDDKSSFLEKMSMSFDLNKEELLEIPYFKRYEQGAIFYISLAVLVVLILLLMLVSFFEPLSNLKMIGILKLQGYTNLQAMKEVNKGQLVIPAIVYLLSVPIQFFFIKNSTVAYFFQLTLFQVSLLIIYYLCFFIRLIIIRNYKLSDVINGYFASKIALYANYFCKLLIFSLLILIIPSFSSGILMIRESLDVQKLYGEQKNYITLSSYEFINSEFQDSLNNNRTLGGKVLTLFKELEETTEAQYMFAEKLLPIFLEPENTKEFSDIYFEEKDFYHVIQANWNYIKTLNLSVNKALDEEQFHLLISSRQKKERRRIEALVRPHINSYLEESKRYETIDEIPVKVVYYDNTDIEVFSNNNDLIGENRGIIKDPIILYMDNYSLTENNSRLLDNPFSNPLKILNTDKNLKNVQKAIVNANLENNNLKLTNAFSAGYEEELTRMKISMMFFVLVFALALLVSSLSSYYIVLITLIIQRKELLVSRFLGYSFLDRYKNQVINVFIIYLFGLIETFVLGEGLVSFLIYVLLIVIDFFIIIYMFRKHDKQLLSTSLKGEFL